MTKEEIIRQSIIDIVPRYPGSVSAEVVEIISPYKLAAFLAKHLDIKAEDLVK